jgi:hypothetical protein
MQKKLIVIDNGAKDETFPLVEFLKSGGFEFETIHLSKGEPLCKPLEDLSGLLIVGGPITIFDPDTAPCLKVYLNS